MNIYDLKNLSWYKADAIRCKERIEELMTAIENCTANQDGMPKGKGGEKYFLETVLDSKTYYENKYAEDMIHILEVETELNAIEDILVRNIFLRKYIDCCSWSQTAKKIGGGNTKDSVRKIVYRYSKKKGWI